MTHVFAGPFFAESKGPEIAGFGGAQPKVFVFGSTADTQPCEEPGPEPAPAPGDASQFGVGYAQPGTYATSSAFGGQMHAGNFGPQNQEPVFHVPSEFWTNNPFAEAPTTSGKLRKEKTQGGRAKANSLRAPVPTQPRYQYGASAAATPPHETPVFQFGLSQPSAFSSSNQQDQWHVGSGLSAGAGTVSAKSIFQFGFAQPAGAFADTSGAASHHSAFPPGVGTSSSSGDSCFGVGSDAAEHVGTPLFAHPTLTPLSKRDRQTARPRIHKASSSPKLTPSDATSANHPEGTSFQAKAVPSDMLLPEEEIRALQQARDRAGQQQYVEAVRACLPALTGPACFVDLLGEMMDDWEMSDRKRVLGLENEKNTLRTQLFDARERSGNLRKLKEDKVAELTIERKRREEAELQLASLRQRMQHLNDLSRENTKLKQQLRSTEQKAKGPPSQDVVVSQVAHLECAPLRRCTAPARSALKKKLLLKWHPDKQPCSDHANFATLVMQEMQNQDEWTW